MNWSTFLTSIDWLTIDDNRIDLIIELLAHLPYKKRYNFLRDFTPFKADKSPKSGDEITDEIIRTDMKSASWVLHNNP